MFIFISRLKMIDPQIYEASEIDGASTFQKNIFVTIPMLKSVAPVAILFATMWAMKVFTIPYVITKGGPNHGTEVLATWAFYHGISYQHVGYGSAISVILLIFGMVLGILIFKFTGMGQSKA
jgi:ABC-type sugar transport system permease subunit